jgi:hypothetical protein
MVCISLALEKIKKLFPRKAPILLNILGRLQAEASLRLLETLDYRLMNNALYYDRLCWAREKQLEDPDDVLIKAEQRKRELAAEQQRREQESAAAT